MLKKIFAGIGIVIGIIFILSLFLGSDQGIDVKSDNMFGTDHIIITNIGTSPTKIVDIIVNNRDDCSSVPNFDSSLNLDRNLYTKDELHKLWVLGQSPSVRWANTGDVDMKAKKTDYRSFKNIELNIGDSHSWPVSCVSLVRVNIVTDKGSGTYSFSSR
jgi:hypothetical protein